MTKKQGMGAKERKKGLVRSMPRTTPLLKKIHTLNFCDLWIPGTRNWWYFPFYYWGYRNALSKWNEADALIAFPIQQCSISHTAPNISWILWQTNSKCWKHLLGYWAQVGVSICPKCGQEKPGRITTLNWIEWPLPFASQHQPWSPHFTSILVSMPQDGRLDWLLKCLSVSFFLW
jgi:hypothetical protein